MNEEFGNHDWYQWFYNGFWSEPLVPMVLQWFLVQQPLDTMVFKWFPMVVNHWSNDWIVMIHRHGLSQAFLRLTQCRGEQPKLRFSLIMSYYLAIMLHGWAPKSLLLYHVTCRKHLCISIIPEHICHKISNLLPAWGLTMYFMNHVFCISISIYTECNFEAVEACDAHYAYDFPDSHGLHDYHTQCSCPQ